MKSKLLQLCCMMSITFSVLLVWQIFSGVALASDADLRTKDLVTMMISYWLTL